MSMNTLTFDGISSASFAMAVFGKTIHDSPRRSVEKVQVPGRNGALLIDNGCFENISVEYDCVITEGFEHCIPMLRGVLCSSAGYCRLEDSFNPYEYRLAAFTDVVKVDRFGDGKGRFSLLFDCKPQRYLKTGETAIAVGSGQTKTLFNPTSFIARPKITVTGTGTFSIAGQQVEVTANSGSIVIDSEIEDCYQGALSRNNVVAMANDTFPVLGKGDNAVVSPSGMTLSIVPNWYVI